MPHEAGLSNTKPFPLNYCSFAQAGGFPHPGRGRVLGARLFFFFTAKAAVCDSLIRPFRRTIPGALSSPCASQQVLAFEGSAMRANACCSPVTRAARSPVRSPAHRTCAVSRAGPHKRIVPGTRSARSANRTRGTKHGELHTRTRMWTRPFQIRTTLVIYILAVHAAGSYPTWSVLALDCDRADCAGLRVRAVKRAADLVRAVARTRRGCQINPLRPSRLATPVSRLDQSVVHFHARTYACHVTHTTRTP